MSHHNCIIKGNGSMKCWGWNANAQLGLGDKNSRGDNPNEMGSYLPFVKIGDGLKVDQVSTGAGHTCVHLTGNQVKCWGDNNSGQLGLGISNGTVGGVSTETPDQLSFLDLGTVSTPSKVACGQYHTCILFANKKVKCFGSNTGGQIGYEGVTSNRGRLASDMGNNLLFIDLGTGLEIESIHIGSVSSHNCVILATTQLMKCWGFNILGQLGYGDINDRGRDPYTMGDNLEVVDLGSIKTVKQIALGIAFTCALRTNDVLLCWGSNIFGQLGIGSTIDVTTMGNTLASTAYDSGKIIKQISAGDDHFCILYNDNLTVKCIGNNSNGKLGQGDTSIRGSLTTNIILSILAIDLGTESLQISYINTKSSSTCVFFVDLSVKCFGGGEKGVLGYGNNGNIGDGPGEMGTNLTFVDVFEQTSAPTKSPTNSPARVPTKSPETTAPTKVPTTATPTKSPTKVPTFKPTKAPARFPTTSPDSLCLYTNQKKCKNDELCDWRKKKCAVFDCTKFTTRTKCIAHVVCDWKNGACRLQIT